MPDFSVSVITGAPLAAWKDPERLSTTAPPLPAAPSRLNPHPGILHKMRLGTIGSQIELQMEVGGVVAPLDTALGGRLFTFFMVEAAGGYVGPTSPAGQSSVQRFTPNAAGHYTIGIRRTSGGAVLVHFDVS